MVIPYNIPNESIPINENGIARLINEIVLAEESDEISKNKYTSHFNLYLQAMSDINADTSKIKNLVDSISYNHSNIIKADIPECAKDFVFTTYQLLNKNKIHISAALFTYGRETTLPSMFMKILDCIEPVENIDNLKLYLRRHIDIDTNRHGPLSLKLFELSHVNIHSRKKLSPSEIWDQWPDALKNLFKSIFFKNRNLLNYYESSNYWLPN